MDIEQLLTTTGSAQKLLDNPGGDWSFPIPHCDDNLAQLYRAAYRLQVGGQMLGDALPERQPSL